jgi:hypothetical protein
MLASRKQVALLAAAITAVASMNALAQITGTDPDVDNGYLDTFNLTDGRIIDVGALGGGLDTNPATKKIFVAPQSPAVATGGRLTGSIDGKLRVVNMQDRNGDGFINGTDLDITFDVSWQLIANDKATGTPVFVSSVAVGPEGSINPNATGVNFPPSLGGTASVWNLAECDGTGFNPNTGTSFCNPFAVPAATPYTGFVNYTFPVSVPGSDDFNPGLGISANNVNWIITALVAQTSLAPGGTGGPGVAYGTTAAFNPSIGVVEANADLFNPNLLLNFPGETANVPRAGLLTTIEIVVTPEPASLALLALGGAALLRRRR